MLIDKLIRVNLLQFFEYLLTQLSYPTFIKSCFEDLIFIFCVIIILFSSQNNNKTEHMRKIYIQPLISLSLFYKNIYTRKLNSYIGDIWKDEFNTWDLKWHKTPVAKILMNPNKENREFFHDFVASLVIIVASHPRESWVSSLQVVIVKGVSLHCKYHDYSWDLKRKSLHSQKLKRRMQY